MISDRAVSCRSAAFLLGDAGANPLANCTLPSLPEKGTGSGVGRSELVSVTAWTQTKSALWSQPKYEPSR